MDKRTADVRRQLDEFLWLPAFQDALVAIDICAALGSENGRSTGGRFRRWCAQEIPSAEVSPEDLWLLRCGLLHQGRIESRAQISFVLPTGHELAHPDMPEDAPRVDLKQLCETICMAVDAWWARESATDPVRRSAASLATERVREQEEVVAARAANPEFVAALRALEAWVQPTGGDGGDLVVKNDTGVTFHNVTVWAVTYAEGSGEGPAPLRIEEAPPGYYSSHHARFAYAQLDAPALEVTVVDGNGRLWVRDAAGVVS